MQALRGESLPRNRERDLLGSIGWPFYCDTELPNTFLLKFRVLPARNVISGTSRFCLQCSLPLRTAGTR